MSFNVFIKENELYLQPDDGQPAYKLVANDKDCFRLLAFAGEEFVRDEKGVVVAINHYQGGGIVEFKKTSAPVPTLNLEMFNKFDNYLQ